MDITICDVEGCGEPATMSLKVLPCSDGPAAEWTGMTADVCGKHDCLGPLIDEWERLAEEDEEES